VPVVIGLVVDRAVATGEIGALLWSGVLLCALFACLSYAYRFGARLGFGAMQREMHQLRVEISAHVLAPEGSRTRLLPGEILSLATVDTEMVGAGLRMVNQIVACAASIALAAWLLLRIDVGLGLVVLVGVPAVLLLVQLVTPRIARDTSAQQETIGRATGLATDLVKGLRPLKGIGAESAATDRYRALSRDAMTASIRTASSYGRLSGLSVALNGLFLAVVALVAGRLAASGDLTIGELIAVVGLAQFLAEPVSALGEMSAGLASSYASAGRIAAYLSSPPLTVLGGDRVPEAADLRVGAVTAGPGELLGVVTTDPADAERLVALARGELEGPASLGGVAYADLSLGALRDRVVVARHHADVFEGTLRSNVTADPEQPLDDVLAASALDEVVALHEEGLEHPTAALGSTLSGGQRQRLALARALAADPPVLVLHDPTTAVDAVTEQRIAGGIRELRHGAGSARTTVVLTSSPALLAHADRVVLLHEDEVLVGDHHTLADHPAYRASVLR